MKIQHDTKYICACCKYTFEGSAILEYYKTDNEIATARHMCPSCADLKDESKYKIIASYSKPKIKYSLHHEGIDTYEQQVNSRYNGSNDIFEKARLWNRDIPKTSWHAWAKARQKFITSSNYDLQLGMSMKLIDHGPLHMYVGVLKAYNDFRFNLMHDGTVIGERLMIYDFKHKQLHILKKIEESPNTETIWLDVTDFDVETCANIKMMTDTHREAWEKSEKHSKENAISD